MENQDYTPSSVPVQAPTSAYESNYQQTPAPKRHRVRKVFLFILITLGILIVAFINIPRVLSLFAHDIPPVDDSDIRLQKLVIPNSENGYFDLEAASKTMYYPEEKAKLINDMIAGITWDDKLAEELISKNQNTLQLFSEASGKPRIQYSLMMDPANINPTMSIVYLIAYRNMNKINSLYSLYLAKNGRFSQALDNTLKGATIGNKMMNSQINLIEYLVAVALKRTSLETAQKIVSISALDNKGMDKYLKYFDELDSSKVGLISAFKSEYKAQISFLDLISNAVKLDETAQKDFFDMIGVNENDDKTKTVKLIGNSYYFERNRTMELFAENTRMSIKKVADYCSYPKLPMEEKKLPRKIYGMYVEENIVGVILRDIITASLDSVYTKRCEDEVSVGLTKLYFAIKAYKNDTRKYPATLNDLESKYLKEIPNDPFDGGKLKYSPTDKTIYSSYATSTFKLAF